MSPTRVQQKKRTAAPHVLRPGLPHIQFWRQTGSKITVVAGQDRDAGSENPRAIHQHHGESSLALRKVERARPSPDSKAGSGSSLPAN